MTLVEGKIGEKFLLKDIDERTLDTRLLSLGVCRGDACTIENIANGEKIGTYFPANSNKDFDMLDCLEE